MRTGVWSVAVALCGCSFEAQHLALDAGPGDSPDAELGPPLDPSNLDGTGDLDQVTGGLDLAAGMYVLDTTTMQLTRDATVVDLAGSRMVPHTTPPLLVLAVDHFSLAKGATLRVTGDLPLLILSRSDVVIGGRVDASAGCSDGARWCGGPGGGHGGIADPEGNGFLAATGCGPGGRGAGDLFFDEAGAGGGGFGTSGGGGGQSSVGGAGEPGASCGEPGLEPLIGGSGGGAAGYATAITDDKRTPGGGGGGAVQISSRTSIRVEGTIVASGEGGTATFGSDSSGGGGGGSGGAILLEARTVTLVAGAKVAANGGGGASGSTLDAHGAAGLLDPLRAPGGTSNDGTNGGFGGIGEAADQTATGGASRGDGASGGGGGAGRIRLNATTFDIAGAMISPIETRGPFPTAQQPR